MVVGDDGGSEAGKGRVVSSGGTSLRRVSMASALLLIGTPFLHCALLHSRGVVSRGL